MVSLRAALQDRGVPDCCESLVRAVYRTRIAAAMPPARPPGSRLTLMLHRSARGCKCAAGQPCKGQAQLRGRVKVKVPGLSPSGFRGEQQAAMAVHPFRGVKPELAEL